MRFQWSSSRRLSLLSVLVFAKASPFVEASRVRHHCIITDTIVLLSVPPCVDERGHPYYPWVSNVDINSVCAKQIGITHVSYDDAWTCCYPTWSFSLSVDIVDCFHNWFMTWLKWRDALPPVYPAIYDMAQLMIGEGDLAFIFRRQPLRSCCRRLKIEAKGTVSQTQRATSTQRCETISVPQDNPLDTRPQNWHSKSYYRHEQVTIWFFCL